MEHARQVKREAAEEYAKRMLGSPYIETSAKTRVNVDLVFETLAKEVTKKEVTKKKSSSICSVM
jgi:GTPase SAR1 family protein